MVVWPKERGPVISTHKSGDRILVENYCQVSSSTPTQKSVRDVNHRLTTHFSLGLLVPNY